MGRLLTRYTGAGPATMADIVSRSVKGVLAKGCLDSNAALPGFPRGQWDCRGDGSNYRMLSWAFHRRQLGLPGPPEKVFLRNLYES